MNAVCPVLAIAGPVVALWWWIRRNRDVFTDAWASTNAWSRRTTPPASPHDPPDPHLTDAGREEVADAMERWLAMESPQRNAPRKGGP